ncbi:MAG TPA: type II toxin-antitoxin system VapC family toxin [Oleiagrimonas sp.]|nr:type II toxin-antitoxin system VapC family toxin [Oleiagrimonas sp.]
MRLLLDTHALIWWWTDASQLSATARGMIADEHNDILVSAASAWEIATKQRLGKLGLPQLTLRRYVALLAADGFVSLPITTEHALSAGSYPASHGDPFDRMLAAQAELEDLTLVSKDRALRLFGVELLW